MKPEGKNAAKRSQKQKKYKTEIQIQEKTILKTKAVLNLLKPLKIIRMQQTYYYIDSKNMLDLNKPHKCMYSLKFRKQIF